MSELVFSRNGIAVTTSLLVAKGVQVEHRAVLQLIRKYVPDFETFGSLIFETVKGKALPQGGFAKSTEIAILNEPQTTLLLTFFKNTEIVRKFKVALVQKFYELRNQLQAKYCPALDRLETLTPLQQEAIREEVSKRALRSAADYQTIYKALRLRFQVTRFDLIPRTKFETALKFIQEVELKAPVARVPDAYLFSYDPKTLSDDELESLGRLIYLLDLAKPTNKQVYAGLRAVYSDLSPRFYSLMTETAISESNLKKVLDRNRINYQLPTPN